MIRAGGTAIGITQARSASSRPPPARWDTACPPPPPPRCATRTGRWSRWPEPAASCCTERKSVVQGKSVSVRVDLGGRRIIQKLQAHTEHQERSGQLV